MSYFVDGSGLDTSEVDLPKEYLVRLWRGMEPATIMLYCNWTGLTGLKSGLDWTGTGLDWTRILSPVAISSADVPAVVDWGRG